MAHETQLRTEDIEILLVKKFFSPNGFQTTVDPSTLMDNNDVLQIVEGQETLAGIRPDCASNRNHLVSKQSLIWMCVWMCVCWVHLVYH